ncbi:hypothetical protein M758_UG271200 [Ceratodon purpureus]|nr:hypothetical protein M758_UG271200 [Ceratodon purpureus]
MQVMLQSVLSTICRADVGDKGTLPPTGSTAVGETFETARDHSGRRIGRSSGMGSSEEWWDILCQTSDDKGQHNDKGDDEGTPYTVHEQGRRHGSRTRHQELVPRKIDSVQDINRNVSGAEKNTTETEILSNRTIPSETRREKKTMNMKQPETKKPREIGVGDSVWLSNPTYKSTRVATETIMTLGGTALFTIVKFHHSMYVSIFTLY